MILAYVFIGLAILYVVVDENDTIGEATSESSETAQVTSQAPTFEEALIEQQEAVDDLGRQLDDLAAELDDREDLARAKAATAAIWDNVDCVSIGSAVFVAPTLLLTAQHVVEDKDFPLHVTISHEMDGPNVPTFAVELVETHAYFDLAVLRVVGGSAPDPAGCISEAPLPDFDPVVLDLAASQPLEIGADVHVFGYPYRAFTFVDEHGAAVFSPPAVSSGSVVAYEPVYSCAIEGTVYDDPWESCSTDGTLRDGHFLSDAFNASGGSGGPVVSGGKLVGIADSILNLDENGRQDTSRLLRVVTASHFSAWLDDLIAAEDTG